MFEEAGRDKKLTLTERGTDEKERALDRMGTFCFCDRAGSSALYNFLRKEKLMKTLTLPIAVMRSPGTEYLRISAKVIFNHNKELGAIQFEFHGRIALEVRREEFK